MLVLLLLCPSLAIAGTPSVPAAKADGSARDISLSITDCITSALAKNLDISIDRIAPQLAQAQTLSARGIFDPALQLQLQYGAAIYQLSSTSTQGYSTQTSNYGLSLTQLTPFGTQFSLNVNSSSSQESLGILFAEYSSLANVNVTQPLLRGFGTDITQAQIRNARIGESVADAQYLSQLEQIISNVVSAY